MSDIQSYGEKMRVRGLSLAAFRNYESLNLAFSGQHVVLTGHNGAGKTNILEAISLLSPGKGLRRAGYNELIHGAYDKNLASKQNGFTIFARLECDIYGEAQIGTGINDNESTRKVRINGANASADNLLEYSRISWLIPAMDGLFTGTLSDRRRFLDRLVMGLDPLHGRRVINFEKAMRSRNKLLSDNVDDAYWMSALEAQMAELGVAIAAARKEMVRLMGAMIEKMLLNSLFPMSVLSATGLLEAKLDEAAAVDVEEDYRTLLEQNRPLDARAGRTLEGPHRSDLEVSHLIKSMPAALCSTGEQKALLTGLILSHARLIGEVSGMTPILLLDEIAAHLDPLRRIALFEILDQLQAQAFMTGTDHALFVGLEGRAQFLSVKENHVEAYHNA